MKAVDVDAQAARHALVVDRRAHLRAEAGSLDRKNQRGSDRQRYHDQKNPVDGEAHAAGRHRALQPAGHRRRLLLGAVEPGEGGDRDEDDADGEQALVEVARAVQAPVERALQHDARGGRREEGRGEGGEERPAEAVRERHGDIAADHGEAAVRQVDEVHHAQRHRQADREQEEQHPVGEAVEQDAEERREHG